MSCMLQIAAAETICPWKEVRITQTRIALCSVGKKNEHVTTP